MKPRVNPGGPSPKAKYSSVTDSEPVPRGKGEKHPERGVKQYLKPRAYNQWEDDGLRPRLTACLLHNEPATYCAQLLGEGLLAHSQSESES